MSSFVSEESGRLHVHVLATERFQARHFSLKLMRPLTRPGATATAMLPYLWLEGTEDLPSARALMERMDDLYGTMVRTGISKRGDRHIADVYASLPEGTTVDAPGLFEQVRALISDLVTRPASEAGSFLNDHVNRERNLHRRRIESLFDDKIGFAMDRCLETVYRDSPLGVSRLGYLDDLTALDGQTLMAEHHRLLQESVVHAYLVGRFDDAQSAAKETLHWLQSVLPDGDGPPAGAIVPLARRTGAETRVTDEQKVTQGKLNLAYCTGVSYRDDDYPDLLVCNGILGGFTHSKLFENVREKASLAYYASSRLDGLTGVVAVQTGIEIERFDQALQIIQTQVEDIAAGRITDDELSNTKTGLRSQFLQANDQPPALIDIDFIGTLSNRRRTLDDLLDAVAGVTKQQVQEAARKFRLDTVYFLRNEVSAGV